MADVAKSAKLASQQYVDDRIDVADALQFKNSLDCSTNPDYPAASAGHVYRVSVSGRIGGVLGPAVEIGDTLVCFVDGTPGGDHATVGQNWNISQNNIDGAVVGPASSVSGNIPQFSNTGGKTIEDSGVAAGPLSKAAFGVPSADVGGGADAITLTIANGPALVDGLALTFRPEAGNTAGVTINYNAGGAVELLNSEGVALAAGDIKATGPVTILYDATATKWRQLSGGVSSVTAPGAAVTRTIASVISERRSITDYVSNPGGEDNTAQFATAVAQSDVLYFPPGVEISIDPTEISKKIALVGAGMRAGCGIKTRSAPANQKGVLTFTTGSAGSIVRSLHLDSDRANTKSIFNASTRSFAGMLLEGLADDIFIDDVLFKNAVRFGLYSKVASLAVGRVHYENCGGGFYAISARGGFVGDQIANGVDNTGVAFNAHVHDFWDCWDLRVGDLVFRNQTCDAINTSDWQSGVTCVGVKRMSFGVMDGSFPQSDVKKHLPFTFLDAENCVFESAIAEEVAGIGMEINSCHNSHWKNVVLDGGFKTTTAITDKAATHGLFIDHGAFIVENTQRRAVTLSTKCSVDGGTISRFGIGINCNGHDIDFNDIRTDGNWLYGRLTTSRAFLDNFQQAVPYTRNIRHIGGSSNYNGKAGCRSVDVIGVEYDLEMMGNGQDPSASAIDRVNLQAVDANSVASRVSVYGGRFAESLVSASGTVCSFLPGATDANNRLVVTIIEGEMPSIGQTIFFDKVLTGDADTSGRIVARELDEVTVEFTSARTFLDSGTGNLVALTGTWTTDGSFTRQINGVSGAALSEITGPFWIKKGSEYRQVDKVIDDNTIIISSAFTTAASASSMSKLAVQYGGIPLLQHHCDFDGDIDDIFLSPAIEWKDDAASTALSSTTPLSKIRNGSVYPDGANRVVKGNVLFTPPASITPPSNGQLAIEATSNTAIRFKFKGSDGTVRYIQLPVDASGGDLSVVEYPQNQQDADYTLSLSDAGKHVRHNSATAHSYTIPPNASVALPIGTAIKVVNIGAGALSIVPGSGVTIYNGETGASDTSVDIGQFRAGDLLKISTDIWIFNGAGAT